MRFTVGYQGNHGTFSEIAVIQYFQHTPYDPVNYTNFVSIVEDVEQGKLDYALLPVENTTTGIISRTYDLFSSHEIFANGEITVPIRHDLIVVPGTKIEEIKEVYSHPEAIGQCQQFFQNYPIIKAVVYQDTAKSVEYIKGLNDPSKAAIGSRRAAEYYGMESLLKSIQDQNTNSTRFLCVSKQMEIPTAANKISLRIVLRHEPGSLYQALSVLAQRGINLLKLESRPLPGQPFHYCFYVDFRGNLNELNVQEALNEMKECSDDLRILGCYKAWENTEKL